MGRFRSFDDLRFLYHQRPRHLRHLPKQWWITTYFGGRICCLGHRSPPPGAQKNTFIIVHTWEAVSFLASEARSISLGHVRANVSTTLDRGHT